MLQKAKICTQTIQNGVTKKCSIYQKYDGGQAMGEDMRHVQMSR